MSAHPVLRLRPLAAAFLATALLGAPARAAQPDETDEFFKAGKVVELSVEIGKAEMDSLRREPRKYVKATLKEGNKVYKDVGVHLKGAAGSFRGVDDRPGLTLNMDKFADDQRFHGLDKFHLNNSVQDGSYVSELICGEIFLAAGVPASRCGHALVTLNGRRLGMYVLKEGYDKKFARRHFGKDADHGNFYDGGFLRELDQPLQIISGKGDVEPYSELKALVEAAREPDPRRRFERLAEKLDLDRFVTYLALEVAMWDWDGYPMNRNNYRVYHDPVRKKIVFIPSGMDQMYHNPGGPIFPNIQGFVARAFLETPQGREKYLARLREVVDTVLKPEPINKRLDELEARLVPAMAKVNQGAANDLPNQIRRIREGIRIRNDSVRSQLDRLNPASRKKIAGGPAVAPDGFVTRWLFLGPIRGPKGETGVRLLDTDVVGGEANLRPSADSKTKVPGGEGVWKPLESLSGMMELPPAEQCTGYLVAYLVLENEAKGLKLRIGSDDQAKVWINGKPVLRVEADRAAAPDQDTVGNITLNKGVNVVVFKIVNGGGPWGGCLRFARPDGNPFDDVRASLQPDGK
jgi:hypothetical protein